MRPEKLKTRIFLDGGDLAETKEIIGLLGFLDGHVEVLTASVRNLDHLLCAIKIGSDIITAPVKVLKEWGEKGLPLPGADYLYAPKGLGGIPYREVDLTRKWREYNIRHDLTVQGIERFASDWNALIR